MLLLEFLSAKKTKIPQNVDKRDERIINRQASEEANTRIYVCNILYIIKQTHTHAYTIAFFPAFNAVMQMIDEGSIGKWSAMYL